MIGASNSLHADQGVAGEASRVPVGQSKRAGPPAAVALDGPDLDEATATWAAAVNSRGGKTSERHLALVDGLIRTLKSRGIWQHLDRLWIFAAQTPAQALTDLVAQAPARVVNDPAFVAGKGYVFDGVSQYIDTGFNAARTPSAKYSVNDAGFGGFVFAAPSVGGGVEFGNDYGAYSMLVTHYGETRRFQVNALDDPPHRLPARETYIGFFHGQRTGEQSSELFLDGVRQGRSSARSARVPDATFYVGAGRIEAGPSHHSTASISTAHIGSSLSDHEVAWFNNALRAYLDAVETPAGVTSEVGPSGTEQESRVQSISELLVRADTAQRNGEWAAVCLLLEELRKRHPDERAGWVRGGITQFRHGDRSAGEVLLAEAMRRFPDDASVAVEYAVAAAAREDRSEEIRRWAHVREHFPDNWTGWVRGGITELRYGDLGAAEDLLAEAIRRFPENGSAAVEYAVAAAMRQDRPEEIRRWAYVREQFPDNWAGWVRGATTELRYGDLDAAENLLAEAVRRFPDNGSAAVEYAVAAATRQDWPEEIRRWAQVRERFPDNWAGWIRGGTTELRYGDPVVAESLLAEAVRRFPNDISAAVEHAVAAAMRQDWPEEIRRWAHVRERFPADRAGWVRGGITELRHGDSAIAERLLSEAVRRFPDDAAAAREYAGAATTRRQWAEASKRWAYVRERFPDDRAGWIHGANACLWFMVEGIAKGQRPDECDAYVWLVLQEPVDWNDSEFLPIGVGLTTLGGYDTTVQLAIIGRLSEALAEQLSTGSLTEAGELIALCLNLQADKLPIDRLVDKYVRSASYRLFCNIFYRENKANVSALLRWARRAVAETAPMPLGSSQVFQLALFLETHDHALSVAALRHYVRSGTKGDGDELATLLQQVLSIREPHEAVEAPSIVDGIQRRLRIAVCVSGQLRGFEQALSTWSFLDAGHQIDRFVHTWRAVGWKMPGPTTAGRVFTEPLERAFVQGCTLVGLSAVLANYPTLFEYLKGGGDAATAERLKKLYATEHVRVEDDLDSRFSGFSNQRKMQYKIRECHRLALDASDHYDLMLRIRPDLALEDASKLDFERIHFDCTRRRVIFAESNSWIERNGYCVGDQFAIGTLDCMTAFAETYDQPLAAEPGKLPHLLADFRAHVNLGHATFRSGIITEVLKGVGFGPLLNPAALTSDQVRKLILKDMSTRPRNLTDELFLQACDEAPSANGSLDGVN